MMMEATELGLGSIWVMYWNPEKMKAEFELDDEIESTALLIVGYKSEKAKPRQGHMAKTAMTTLSNCKDRSTQDRITEGA